MKHLQGASVEDVDVEDVVEEDVKDVDVDVVVEAGTLVVDVVVVARVPTMGSVTELVHTPFDFTIICVAALGTNIDVYPATNEALGTFTSKGFTNPSASENRSKGPVSAPANVNVINTVCGIMNVLYKINNSNLHNYLLLKHNLQ